MNLRFLGAVCAAALAILAIPTAAHASQTITATESTGCPSGQIMTAATFTMTGTINTQQITANTELSAITKSPTTFSGGTATYKVMFDARFDQATATVASDWDGDFKLSAATCRTPAKPTLTPVASLCGLPVSLAVYVRNPNPIMVGYDVNVPGSGTKHIDVLAGHTEELDFAPVTRGNTYVVSASGDDGTAASTKVTVDSCGGAPVPPAPKKPTQPMSSTPTNVQASAKPGASNAQVSPSTEPDFVAEPIGTPPSDEPSVDAIGQDPQPSKGGPWFVSPIVCMGVVLIIIGIGVIVAIVTKRNSATTAPTP